MSGLISDLTGGDVLRAKVMLSSIVVSLAAYQVFLQAVGYGKIRLPFLEARPASQSHKAIGDTIVVLGVVLAVTCISTYGGIGGIENVSGGERVRVAIHVVSAVLLVGVLGFKIAVLRVWRRRFNKWLPALGMTAFALLVVIWLASGFDYLVNKIRI